MKKQAVKILVDQLTKVAVEKHNRLYNIGLFMGQLEAYAMRKQLTPDWGTW